MQRAAERSRRRLRPRRRAQLPPLPPPSRAGPAAAQVSARGRRQGRDPGGGGQRTRSPYLPPPSSRPRIVRRPPTRPRRRCPGRPPARARAPLICSRRDQPAALPLTAGGAAPRGSLGNVVPAGRRGPGAAGTHTGFPTAPRGLGGGSGGTGRFRMHLPSRESGAGSGGGVGWAVRGWRDGARRQVCGGAEQLPCREEAPFRRCTGCLCHGVSVTANSSLAAPGHRGVSPSLVQLEQVLSGEGESLTKSTRDIPSGPHGLSLCSPSSSCPALSGCPKKSRK